MSMNAKESFHQDHEKWSAEVKEWMGDLERWRAEHRFMLKHFAEAVANHNDALDAHAKLIQEITDARAAHEHAFASEKEGHRLADADDLDVEHGAYASRHDAQKEAHERIGKHHRGVVDAFEKLKAALARGE